MKGRKIKGVNTGCIKGNRKEVEVFPLIDLRTCNEPGGGANSSPFTLSQKQFLQ